jgi:hypothetical protein
MLGEIKFNYFSNRIDVLNINTKINHSNSKKSRSKNNELIVEITNIADYNMKLYVKDELHNSIIRFKKHTNHNYPFECANTRFIYSNGKISINPDIKIWDATEKYKNDLKLIKEILNATNVSVELYALLRIDHSIAVLKKQDISGGYLTKQEITSHLEHYYNVRQAVIYFIKKTTTISETLSILKQDIIRGPLGLLPLNEFVLKGILAEMKQFHSLTKDFLNNKKSFIITKDFLCNK